MKIFIKEWGFFLISMVLFFLSLIFIWHPVKVDGHSMDPTLADGERLIVLSTNVTSVKRFDIVVAQETEDGASKDIVKRVIGMPGDTIAYKDDVLYINNKEVDEDYLSDYLEAFEDDSLQDIYSYSSTFQELAENSNAFTTDSKGNTEFVIEVPEGQYFLMGDDRIVSKDSREVGTFEKSAIIGKVVFRFWPLTSIGTVD